MHQSTGLNEAITITDWPDLWSADRIIDQHTQDYKQTGQQLFYKLTSSSRFKFNFYECHY